MSHNVRAENRRDKQNLYFYKVNLRINKIYYGGT
nr:MAG TPA: hypothetical protein [Caudoviricetes sp.]